MTVVSLMLRSLPLVLLLLSFDGIGQELKVMTFNIWHGGRETGEEEGPRRVVDVIRDSGADVVAMQETYGSGARIAEALGYHLYLRSANLSIMSRYPIVDTLDAYEPFNSGAVIIDVHGKHVVVASTRLNFRSTIGICWKKMSLLIPFNGSARLVVKRIRGFFGKY